MTFAIPVSWEPEKYLKFFDGAEGIKEALMTDLSNVNKQIKRKKINPESLAYLDDKMNRNIGGLTWHDCNLTPIAKRGKRGDFKKICFKNPIVSDHNASKLKLIKEGMRSNITMPILILNTGLSIGSIQNTLTAVYGSVSLVSLWFTMLAENKRKELSGEM